MGERVELGEEIFKLTHITAELLLLFLLLICIAITRNRSRRMKLILSSLQMVEQKMLVRVGMKKVVVFGLLELQKEVLLLLKTMEMLLIFKICVFVEREAASWGNI